MNKQAQNSSYQGEVLHTLAFTHNYNDWVYELLEPWLGNNILEIGCGTGNITKYLPGSRKITCVDKSELFVKHMRIDYPEIDFHVLDISDEKAFDGKILFDTIICVNVLEHIKDDMKALSNMHRLLSSGGRLLLYVPSQQWVYGTLDKHLGHHRRYVKNELVRKASAAGFEVKTVYYSNFFALFGWFLSNRVLKKRSSQSFSPCCSTFLSRI